VAFLAWLAPFAIFALVIVRRRTLTTERRTLIILASLAGNILLLFLYAQALAALDRLERANFMAFADRCMREHLADACPAGFPIWDPPQPPLHWEWAVVGWVLASAGLYFLLHLLALRLERGGGGESGGA
jgi:hypothetical protein